MKNFIFLLYFVFIGCAISEPHSSTSSNNSFRSQLENHVWEITQIASYPEMRSEDYFTAQFKDG